MIRAVLVAAFLIVYIPLASLLGWLLAFALNSAAPLYRLGRVGVRAGLILSGTRVRVEGREHLREFANTMVMSNHVSNLDAPVLFQVLGIDFKAVAKNQVFRVPFLGRTLRMAQFVPVMRGDREQTSQAMAQTAQLLRSGSCFLVFPEGTRSPSGELGEFKKGAFLAAIEAQSRIVPVALRGTREMMPKGGFRIRPGTVTVRVLEPVSTAGCSAEDRERIAADVRGRIAAALQWP